MHEIANEDLTLDLVPNPDADWATIGQFALTFNGYAGLGDECAVIANTRRHDSLTDLRACLFFEQRRWRHFGEAPDEETMGYVRTLLEKIRQWVASGDLT